MVIYYGHGASRFGRANHADAIRIFVRARSGPSGSHLSQAASSAAFPDKTCMPGNASGARLVHRHSKPTTVSGRVAQLTAHAAPPCGTPRDAVGADHLVTGHKVPKRLDPYGSLLRLGVNGITHIDNIKLYDPTPAHAGMWAPHHLVGRGK
jgi:hypothetical protein